MTSLVATNLVEAKQQSFDKHFYVMMVVSLSILLLFSVVSLSYGPAGWSWQLSIAWITPQYFNHFSELQLNIISEIRLPRLCLAILIGLVLAQTGSATQALCRNSLADPSIIGVTSGAAVAAVLLISMGEELGINVAFWLPIAAFIGALLVTYLVYQVANHRGQLSVSSLILVGVALNAIAFALIGLLSYLADDSALRLINYWTMGSLAGATWSTLINATPLLMISVVGLFVLRNKLSMLMLGESEARFMGVDVKRLKQQVIVFVAIGVGAAVALAGMIGFIGLVVPHICRLLVGPNLSRLMPLSMSVGAVVLLFSDWIARNIVTPAELPIGIITALLGAPLFLYLLIQQRGRHA